MSLNVNNNVGYTVVDSGSISVVNDIASGFSTNDYLDLSQKIDITQNVHIHIDVLSFAATGSSQYIFGLINGDGSSGGLYFGSTAVGMAFSYGASYWTSIATGLTIGAPLTVDVVSDGIDFSITVNQGTYTKTSTKTLADLGITGSYTLRLGKLFQAFTSGVINLNKTYVKINGITWFNGKQQASTTVNDVYLNRNVGYTKVGNPTIVDGVASGFSSNDYFKVNGLNWSSSIKLEFVCRFKVDTSLITFTDNYTNICYWPFATYFYIGSNTSPTTIVPSSEFSGISGGVSYGKIPTNQYYWIKLEIDGNGNATTYSSEDGTTWTQKGTKDISSTTSGVFSLTFGFRYNTGGFPGSIDLNNTYIKVNGVTWFSGKQQASTTVNEVYLNRNVGYTVVGSPTINDGIVSGFISYPNQPYSGYYLRITDTMDFSSDFEIVSRFKLSSASAINCCLIGRRGGGLACVIRPSTSSVYYGLTNSAGTQFQTKVFTTTKTLQENKWYISKTIKENTTLRSILIEEESGTTIIDDYITLTDTIRNGGIAIGVDYVDVAYQAFQGSIDLNNTYIKVNGVTWFNGKDVNFSNQNNYIINNGNIVWANPNLWLESSGTQYIDTGYTPIQYDEIKTDIMFTSSDFSVVRTIFSAGTENYQFTFGPFDTKTYFKYFAQGSASEINFLPNINTWYSLNIDENGVCSFGGYTTTSTYTSALDGDNTTMYLFMRRNNTSSFIGKLKSFIIKNKGIIKKHFVPVPKGLVIGNYTVPSNGMWDIVTQTFFANQGTGNFIFGKDGTTPIWTRSV